MKEYAANNIHGTMPEDEIITDAGLLLRISLDDVSALEQIYYRWNKQVYGFMLDITCSTSDSEEITQETFARLWNKRKDIDPYMNIKSLIFMIARRVAADTCGYGGKTAETCDMSEEGILSELLTLEAPE